MQNATGHAPIVDVIAAAGVQAARKDTGAGPEMGLGFTTPVASGSGTVRSSTGLPIERGGSGRDVRMLSVVREEVCRVCGACGECGACEVCAEALNFNLESTASGEWNIVLTGNGPKPH
jgi:hypothetical protein